MIQSKQMIGALSVASIVLGCAAAPTRESVKDLRTPANAASTVENGFSKSICGLTGTAEEKMVDCGETVVTPEKGEFSLLSRSADGKEVWFDQKNQRIANGVSDLSPH